VLMTAVRSDHFLLVTDLVERPGASRKVDLAVPVPADFDLPLTNVRDPLEFDGVIESVVDGLLVRGRLRAGMRLACCRCLRPLQRETEREVVELFSDPEDRDADDEVEAGYEIREGAIEISALLRDALSGAAPLQPLCQEGCRGLCAQCGTNLNETSCDCADIIPDSRWEALRDLRLPDGRS
jgi:uncharacterized protein